MADVFILGISAFYHDSAACLLRNGEILAAAQEERFTRVKGDASFPARAIAFCLARAGIPASELAAVAFYDKPLLKLDRLLETYLWLAPRGLRQFLQAGPLWGRSRLRVAQTIREELGGYEGRVLFSEHHEAHAASAFYPSPFAEAAVLTIDGVGEWATAAIGRGSGAELTLTHELHWPDSLGLLYSAFTYHAGFRVNSGEYKLMGLAPYGEPRYVDRILRELLTLRDDGSFVLHQRYFDYLGGLTMTNDAFAALFDGPPRVPESRLTQREMDLARSVQEVCEEVVRRMARTAVRESGCRALCLAGGVALNAVTNGKLLRERIADRLWIQPAAGDAGGALGAALLAWHRYFQQPRRADGVHDAMHGALLGPCFTPDEMEAELRAAGATYRRLPRAEVVQRVAGALAEGAVVGWFDGPMEFGPRALGARSILADPRDPAMQARLNLKIKFREGFRPFAPSVLASRAAEFFELEEESPYMLLVAPVCEGRRLPPDERARTAWGIDRLNVPRSDIPAVTHLDYTARVQTVTSERAPGLSDVLGAFEARTGCPVLVNTSFNVRGEPMVCTPADAYACFMRTDIDWLAMPPFLLSRAEQPRGQAARWQRATTAD
ncbi:MAG TPA: carbamoyltransferase N-terminal domain-containing protein [Gemmatimonadaceae bacterium]|nr:carbamoyltransferase N-terminal domain-containing protein [Gemmatimonadaceae bacterium]